jgi:Pyruvate/2-oxoacid:ferredoxin oxidoreductase gamma subunit
MSEVKSILLVGVGGQGAILTAKVLVNGLMPVMM